MDERLAATGIVPMRNQLARHRGRRGPGAAGASSRSSGWLPSPRPTPTGADALAAELRCPDCQGLSVADSQTASAREIRRQVDELVACGATDDDVREHFVDRYGEWILLAPTSPAAWILPFAALALGVAASRRVARAHGGQPIRRRRSRSTTRRAAGCTRRPRPSMPETIVLLAVLARRRRLRARAAATPGSPRSPRTSNGTPPPSAIGSRWRRCATWRRTGAPDRSTSAATPSSWPRPRRVPRSLAPNWTGRQPPRQPPERTRLAGARRRSRPPLVGVVLVVGSWLPASGIANATDVNEGLAAAQAAEAARQGRDRPPAGRARRRSRGHGHPVGPCRRVPRRLDRRRARQGGGRAPGADRARAGPRGRLRAAHRRLPAGRRLRRTARRALDSYEERETADPVEVAFFDGLIALTGENDPEHARAAFDRFLELAPDDPRAEMIRGLRAQADESPSSP